MKEIAIILTDREWFALTHSGIGKTGRRKAFGVSFLTKNILEQLKKEITATQYDKLNAEWLKLAPLFPDQSSYSKEKNKIGKKLSTL